MGTCTPRRSAGMNPSATSDHLDFEHDGHWHTKHGGHWDEHEPLAA